MKKTNPRPPEAVERRRRVKEDRGSRPRGSGMTLAALAKKYKVSTERIRQLLERAESDPR